MEREARRRESVLPRSQQCFFWVCGSPCQHRDPSEPRPAAQPLPPANYHLFLPAPRLFKNSSFNQGRFPHREPMCNPGTGCKWVPQIYFELPGAVPPAGARGWTQRCERSESCRSHTEHQGGAISLPPGRKLQCSWSLQMRSQRHSHSCIQVKPRLESP